MFYRNVGGIDRVLRMTLGPVLILAGIILLTGKTSVGIVLTVVGLLVLLTGIFRICVLYLPFGISTTRSSKPWPGCDCEQWMKNEPAGSAPVCRPAAEEEQALKR